MKTFIFLSVLMTIGVACSKHQSYESITEQTPWGEEVFELPVFRNKIFNVIDYGAEAVSGINNQGSIQKAIDACNENGGGTVLIPPGNWETAYLTLKSNVNMKIEEGAVLSFMDDIDLYAVPTFTRWEGLECLNYHPLIYAFDAENIAISGKGKLVGNGQAWWDMAKGTQKSTLSKLYDMVQAGVEPMDRNCLALEPQSYLRPSFIQLVDCKNVLVEDFEIGSGPMWTVHFVYSENVIARNLKVITDGTNNDGITPDACKKVLIDNCFFSTGDDCIVIKSGLNEDGWRVGKASERIVIKNCNTRHGHGGVVIGSEMSGGVRNVYAHDCNFSHTQRGLRVKSMKGRGGIVENLWFDNIVMDSIRDEAIRINMHYGASSIEPRTDKVPVFRNFNFSNIHSSYAKYCMRVDGIEGHNIEGLHLENIDMKGKYGIVMKHTESSTFDSVSINALTAEPIQLSDCHDIGFDHSNFKAASAAMALLRDSCSNINIRNANAADFQMLYAGE